MALLALPTVAGLAAYMAYNFFSGLSIIPTSGMAKSDIAAFSGNVGMFLSGIFFPPIHELIRPKYDIAAWPLTAARTTVSSVANHFLRRSHN